jgi:hypothetical protein
MIACGKPAASSLFPFNELKHRYYPSSYSLVPCRFKKTHTPMIMIVASEKRKGILYRHPPDIDEDMQLIRQANADKDEIEPDSTEKCPGSFRADGGALRSSEN